MPKSAEERLAALAALPPTIHLTFHRHVFRPGRQGYWYAGWTEKITGKQHVLYLGKEPPTHHPCFSGQCGHPHRPGHSKGTPPYGPKVKRTATFLQTLLQSGSRREQDVWEAVQHAGCSHRTYHRARQMLGVEAIRVGQGKNGWWELQLGVAVPQGTPQNN